MIGDCRDKKARDKAVEKSGNRCIICGWYRRDLNNKDLLDGAHVRDYSDEPQYDTYDNIVAMCPNHHREYDRGLITFDSNGIIHSYFPDAIDGKLVCGNIRYIRRSYIEWHNKNVYHGEINIDQ